MNELADAIERPHIANLAAAHSHLIRARNEVRAAEREIRDAGAAYLADLAGDKDIPGASPDDVTAIEQAAFGRAAGRAWAALRHGDYAPVRHEVLALFLAPPAPDTPAPDTPAPDPPAPDALDPDAVGGTAEALPAAEE